MSVCEHCGERIVVCAMPGAARVLGSRFDRAYAVWRVL